MKKKNSRQVGPIKTRTASPTNKSQAQIARDRQQCGVAAELAREAQRLFPALNAGTFQPEQLYRQTQYVVDMARLSTSQHALGQIEEDHAAHLASSMRTFAAALAAIGVKVPGLLHIKQRHYLEVIRHWERHPPGDARMIGWSSSHLRRVFVAIGHIGIVPKGSERLELFRKEGLLLGNRAAFLVNKYVDWRSRGLDAEAVFLTIPDPGRSIAARMMFFWGLSAGELAHWVAVDPAATVALSIHDLDGRRSARDAEFSLDPQVEAGQLQALCDAWEYCRDQGRSSLRPEGVSPELYGEHLRGAIRHAFSKVLKGCKITPIQLRDAFFCQVFLDHSGVSLQAAVEDRSLAASDGKLARAWNEAKMQLGVRGSKAAFANAGLSVKQQRGMALAVKLRECSDKLALLGAAEMWVGDVDAALGTCVVVRLKNDAGPDCLPRMTQLLESCVAAKLRVVEHGRAGEVLQDCSRVLMRRPRETRPDVIS